MNDNSTRNAIAANIDMLRRILRNAVVDMRQAAIAMAAGEQNGAVGTMAHLQNDLEQALGLYHAIMALHRNPRSRS